MLLIGLRSLEKMVSSYAMVALLLKKMEVLVVDGSAIAPQDIVKRAIEKWEKTLVGFFVSRRLGFPTVKKHLENRWAIKEPLEMWLDRNLFYLKINNEELKERILDGGLVFILGVIIVI